MRTDTRLRRLERRSPTLAVASQWSLPPGGERRLNSPRGRRAQAHVDRRSQELGLDWRKGHRPHDAEYIAKTEDAELSMCIDELIEVIYDIDDKLDLSDNAIPEWETINHP